MSIVDKVVSEVGAIKEKSSEMYEDALEKKAISEVDERLIALHLEQGELGEGKYEEMVADKKEELRESHKGIIKGAAFVLGVDWLL